MKNPKKLPIGIQDFEKLRRGGYVYVDKTERIHHLITNGVAWFLSRPRRFGKSLLVSTLEAIFEGRRDLFQGLWIENSGYNWPVYPVVHIDLSRITFQTPEELDAELVRQLAELAIDHGLEPVALHRAAPMLDHLISHLARKKGKVVVLVDEYDKPILDSITDVSRALDIRDRLRGFYTILKAQDKNLHFVFLTGVTQFSKVSVFSGINHLDDISYSDEYATLLGYTQAELESAFADHLQAIARQAGVPVSEPLDGIRSWYNGYRFSPALDAVYNPFSCLMYFRKWKLQPWWFGTGTPTFLIDLLRHSSLQVADLERKVVSNYALSSFEVDRLELVPLLHQSGYLTITGYDPESNLYTLDYPNREVREAFFTHLLETFSGLESGNAADELWRLREALLVRDPEAFFAILTGLFAGVPYDIQIPLERYYQSLFYLIFRLMGLHVHTEVRTASGRIDATVELESSIWIFEFKLGGSADVALAQIREKNYAAPYAAFGKPVYLVGVNFDSKKRNVGEWKMEALESRNGKLHRKERRECIGGNFRARLGYKTNPGFLSQPKRLAQIDIGRSPFVTGTELPENSPIFFGRVQVMREILSALCHPERPGCVSLLGERRMGKSSLLNQIFAALSKEEGLVTIIGNTRGWSEYTPVAFFSDLHRTIADVLPTGGSADSSSLSPVTDYLGFRDFIRRYTDRYRFVLILDEFETMAKDPKFDAEFFHDLRHLGNTPQFRFGYLLASRQPLSKLRVQDPGLDTSSFWNIFGIPHMVGLLQPEDVRKLILEPWQRSLRGKPLSTEEIETIKELADMHPAFLQMVLDRVWTARAGECEPNWNEIKRGLWEHFGDLWKNRSREEKEILLDIAEGKSVADTALLWDLRSRGLMTEDNRLFSKFFKDFVVRNRNDSD